MRKDNLVHPPDWRVTAMRTIPLSIMAILVTGIVAITYIITNHEDPAALNNLVEMFFEEIDHLVTLIFGGASVGGALGIGIKIGEQKKMRSSDPPSLLPKSNPIQSDTSSS